MTAGHDDLLELAAGFDRTSEAGWRALVERELKGSAAESLDTATRDGIAIPALATRRDAEHALAITDLRSGGARVRSLIADPTPEAANAAIKAEVAGGAEEILLAVEAPGRPGVRIAGPGDLELVFDGVPLERVALHRRAPAPLDAAAADLWFVPWDMTGIAPPARSGGLGLDPIGWAATGSIRSVDLEALTVHAAGIAAAALGRAPEIAAFTASSLAAHEAGGSEVQELAMMLASGVAYLRACEAGGIAPEQSAPRIELELAADAQLFLTIAKLRAARAVWARLLEACGVDRIPARLHVQASARMMCAADPNTNILRTTVAALAAGIGGADAITVLPFTHPAGRPNELAGRIARNTGLVLREESMVGAVADPAAGSFAIERLTADLAGRAWALFREIEAEGGMAAALRSGLVQRRIAAAREGLRSDLASGDTVLVGATAYRAEDGTTDGLEPWSAPPPVDPGFEPLTPIRLENLAGEQR